MFKNITLASIANPLKSVVGIVDLKSPMPIMGNVLIERTGTQIRMTSTDGDIQITALSECESGEDSSITVGGKRLAEVLKAFSADSKVSVELKDGKAIVKSGKSRFSLQTLPAADFPVIGNQTLGIDKIKVSQGALKELLSSVRLAMSKNDVRYYLNGILIEVCGTVIKAVATDGHRLIYNAITTQSDNGNASVIVPAKVIGELLKMLSDSVDEFVEIEFTTNQVKASFSGIEIISKLIGGQFPNYNRVIPKYTGNELVIGCAEINSAMQKAAILSNEKFRGVRFVLTENNLSLISSNTDQEEANIEIETQYSGDVIDSGFNVSYVIDAVNSVGSNDIVMQFRTSTSSMKITSSSHPEFVAVVMPMRL
jgi:DNA polymerase-3 subunit beta